jgi:hypothetical protein
MEGEAVSVCPGPNMAYYSGKFSLKQMVDHIYGRINLLNTNNRPNMFIKELKMYVEYLSNKIEETPIPFSEKQIQYFETFKANLNNGIEYYKQLFYENKESLKISYENVIAELQELENEIQQMLFEPKTT